MKMSESMRKELESENQGKFSSVHIFFFGVHSYGVAACGAIECVCEKEIEAKRQSM